MSSTSPTKVLKTLGLRKPERSKSFKTPFKEVSENDECSQSATSNNRYRFLPKLSLSQFKPSHLSTEKESNSVKRSSSENIEDDSPSLSSKVSKVEGGNHFSDTSFLITSNEELSKINTKSPIVTFSEPFNSSKETLESGTKEKTFRSFANLSDLSVGKDDSRILEMSSNYSVNSPETVKFNPFETPPKNVQANLLKFIRRNLDVTDKCLGEELEMPISAPTPAGIHQDQDKSKLESSMINRESPDNGISIFNLSLDDLISDYTPDSTLPVKDNDVIDLTVDDDDVSINMELKNNQSKIISDNPSTPKDAAAASVLQPESKSKAPSLNLSSSDMDSIRNHFDRFSKSLQEESSRSKRSSSRMFSGRSSASSYSKVLEGSSTDLSIRRPGEDMDEKILSILYDGTCLGAAVYHTESNKLELLKDLPDTSGQFEILEILLYRVEPDLVLISSRQEANLIDFVKEIFESQDVNNLSRATETNDTSSVTSYPSQMVFRPGAEFSFTTCERRLKNINLPVFEETENSYQERAKYLSTYIDFSCTCMVRAAGSLMKFVDKNYRLDNGEPDVLFIAPLDLGTIMGLDWATLTSLQIFSSRSQLSGSTAGSWNKTREGLSLFNILNRCSSVVGSRCLRQMLRCPLSNVEVIERRQEDIAFFSSNSNAEFCKSLSASLKKIKNFPRLIKKLSGNSITVNDWVGLGRTLNGIAEVGMMANSCTASVSVLHNIVCHVSDTTYYLRNLLEKVVDLKTSAAEGVLRINPGIDKDLDEKRRLYNGLPDLLQRAAEEEMMHLPHIFDTCRYWYLPNIGFLLTIPFNQNLLNQGIDPHNIEGLEFVFETNNTKYYRNTRTKSLDALYGDVKIDITSLETKVINRLSECILTNCGSLETIVTFCAQLDCLLSVSQVVKEQNWRRPSITTAHAQELVILKGRHPLQELTVTNFITNDTQMGGRYDKVHLITGPNSSGKSVYMKQVGLIVYLAHLGCFVPAAKAVVPLMTRIFTRIQTTESVSVGMSAFMCDLNQLSTPLSSINPRSLLLVDEFGKGTSATDGAALLAATVSILSSYGNHSPYSIFSTHFHSVPSLIDIDAPLKPKYLHMKTEAKGADLVYYFKLAEGVCGFSHASVVAKNAGVKQEVLERSESVHQSIVDNKPLSLDESLVNKKEINDLMSNLLDLNLEDKDEIAKFMGKVRALPI